MKKSILLLLSIAVLGTSQSSVKATPLAQGKGADVEALELAEVKIQKLRIAVKVGEAKLLLAKARTKRAKLTCAAMEKVEVEAETYVETDKKLFFRMVIAEREYHQSLLAHSKIKMEIVEAKAQVEIMEAEEKLEEVQLEMARLKVVEAELELRRLHGKAGN